MICFDESIAAQYGVMEAILLKHISYWICRNAKNGRNYRYGRYWTYDSYETIAARLGFCTARQVRYAIMKMEDQGLLIIDNCNENGLHMNWYSLTEKAMLLTCPMHHDEVVASCDNFESCFDEIVTSIEHIDNTYRTHLSFSGEVDALKEEPEPEKEEEREDFSEKEENGEQSPEGTPPTLEEVEEYCRASGFSDVSPKRFWNHYERLFWKIRGRIVRNWKHLVNAWHNRNSFVSETRERERASYSEALRKSEGSPMIRMTLDSLIEKGCFVDSRKRVFDRSGFLLGNVVLS